MRKIKDPVKLVFEFILVGILFFIFYIALSYHNFYEKRADFTAKGTDFSIFNPLSAHTVIVSSLTYK